MVIKEGTNVVISNEADTINAKISSIIIDEQNDFIDLELTLENGDNKFYAFESFGKKLFLSKSDLVNAIKYKQMCRLTLVDGEVVKSPMIVPNYFEKNHEINENVKKLNLVFSEKVKAFIEMHNITDLYHFTNVLNLKSILENDLMPVTHLKHKGLSYLHNDESRLDGKLDCVSLSISFPNTRYMNTKENQDYELNYCIIEYDAHLLEKAAAFNKVSFSKYNAARSDTLISSDYEALVSMFDDSYYKMNPTRYKYIYGVPSSPFNREEELPLKYPTHDQAEILINAMINKRHIKRVIFKTIDVYERYVDLLNSYGIDCDVNPDYFKSREEFIRGEYNG